MKIYVIKRDGRKVPFKKDLILNAITAAGKEIYTDDEKGLARFMVVANYMTDDIVLSIKHKLTENHDTSIGVETIQDIVENELLESDYPKVAQAYIRYRQKRTDERQKASEIFQIIKEKIEASNVVNQNANVDEHSFGGRAGEAKNAVLKDYALRYCMSPISRNNHENNEIYIHDLDSYAVGMHNCYDASTRFITYDGVRNFKSCNDGEVVKVLAIDGEWREATVHKYGKQKMYKLTFKSSLTRKTVTCTRNHRWVLDDGTVTDNINVGDSLALTPKVNNNEPINDNLWCIGFVLGDGCDIKLWSKDRTHVTNGGMKVRLCGDKITYLPTFLKCGWSEVEHFDNGDVTVYTSKYGAFKQRILDNELWKVMPHNDLISIFKGYIDADGFKYENGSVQVSTSDKRLLEFVRYASSPSGYFLWSQRHKHGDTNFKKDRELWEMHLVEKQSTKWTLERIESSRQVPQTAWCVEEPVTHTFTLDGAMVTGNCLSIPFDDLLAKGFNTRQTDVRPAKSVNTAMQLVAVVMQLQSLCEFGGVAATHLDWTMVPYVRLSFNKHFIDGIKYLYGGEFSNWSEDSIREVSINSPKYKEYPKAYKYAMDMTTKETYQAVEGLYHNLNTLQSRSGNQLPFTSINYGTCTLPEGRMVIKALLDVSIKGIGKLHRTPIFPCGIFQYMKGVNDKPGTPNYDLFRLALKSTSKRLYPNYCNVDWSGNKGYDRNDPRTYTATMGCRTYNGYDINGYGQLKDGRGNICPVTIIMPTLAMEADRDTEKFMKLLDKKIHEAKDMLLERYEWICSQPMESAKFMYENGTMYGYNEKEGIRGALKHGTLAIGQLGLAETLQLLVGCDQTDPKGFELGKRIEALFRKRADEFKQQYKLNFGVYLSPAENLSFTAMTKFKKRYGVIENVSDKKYFTNSVHVPVYDEISVFDKIDIESVLGNYSNSGTILYAELDGTVSNNLDALEEIVNYAMEKDVPYFAINVPNDQCLDCGYTAEINDKCPKCGSQNVRRLRRVTGYLTNDYKTAFNAGKQQEVEMRVKHSNRKGVL